MGRVGNDVVLRYTQGGTPVVNLRVATDDRRREGPEVTTWHRVVLWDKLAELAHRYVRKGQPLYVEGPLVTRQWTDQAGATHWQTEMTARELIFLGERPSGILDPPENSVLTSGPEPTSGVRSGSGEELGETIAEIPF